MLAATFARWSDIVGIGLVVVVLGGLVASDLRREAGRKVPRLAGIAVAVLGVLLVGLIVVRFLRREG